MSPGTEAVTTDSGTRESAQPIQRACCTVVPFSRLRYGKLALCTHPGFLPMMGEVRQSMGIQPA